MTELSVEQQAAQLAASYLNKAGAISCQFVIKLKKVSVEVQIATNKKLVELGHPPYDLTGKKSSKKRNDGSQTAHNLVLPLNDEQKQVEESLVKMLDEIRLDREAIHCFTQELGTAEDKIREQLAKLRGVPYDGPLYDPFKFMYKPAHKHSRHNREEIEKSTKCGCFFCRATFEPKAIYTYVEGGSTAVCPNCGVDAIIGDIAGFELSEEFLVAMFRQWFSIPIRLRAVRPIGAPKKTQQVPVETPQPAKEEFIVPPHLEEVVPAGVGTALLNNLADDDEDDEDAVISEMEAVGRHDNYGKDEPNIIPMTSQPVNHDEDDEEDWDDEDDDDDWDDEDDEEDWDDDEEDE